MKSGFISLFNNFEALLIVVLGSSVVSAMVSGFVGFYIEKRRVEHLRYEKLYGPLRFNLSLMKLYSNNQAQVVEDIKQWGNVEVRIAMMQEHLNPLVLKWIECRDRIRELFENNSGLIKKSDLTLVDNFIDGCIKREITEDGKNVLAVNENMTEKLLTAVKSLQDKYV